MVLNSLFIKSNDATDLFDMPKSSKFNNTSYLFSDIIKICNENLSDANPGGMNVSAADNSTADETGKAAPAAQELVKTISSAGNLTELIQQLLNSLNISGRNSQPSASTNADSKLSGIEVLFKDGSGKTEKTLQFPTLLLNQLMQSSDLPAGGSSTGQTDSNSVNAAAQQIVENLQALMKSGGPVTLYINSGNTSLKLDISQMTGGSGKTAENEILPLPATDQVNQAAMHTESAAESNKTAGSGVKDKNPSDVLTGGQTADDGKINSADGDNAATSKPQINPEDLISGNGKAASATKDGAIKSGSEAGKSQSAKIPAQNNDIPFTAAPEVKTKGNVLNAPAANKETDSSQTVKENGAGKYKDVNTADEGFVVKLSAENSAAQKSNKYIISNDLSLLNDYQGKELEGIIIKQADNGSTGNALNAAGTDVLPADEIPGGSTQGMELYYNFIDKDLKQSLGQINDQSKQAAADDQTGAKAQTGQQNAADLINSSAKSAEGIQQSAASQNEIIMKEDFSAQLKKQAGVEIKPDAVNIKDVKEKVTENPTNDNGSFVKSGSIQKQALKNSAGLSYGDTDTKKSGTNDGSSDQSDMMVKAGDALTRGIKNNNLQENTAAHQSADASSAGSSANQSAQAVTAGSGASNANTGRDQSKDGRGNNDFQGTAVQNAAQSVKLNSPAAKAQPRFSQYVENPVPVTTSEMMKEVTGLIKRGESGTVVLKLKPETLGKVKVEINVSDNAVHAHIEVDNDAVRQIVQSNINTLKQSLNLNGLQLSGINVSVSNRDSKWGNGGAPKKKQNFVQVPSGTDETISPAATKSLGYNTYEYLA